MYLSEHLEGFEEPTIGAVCGLDVEFLGRRVNTCHPRTEADHIEIRVLLEEESALESCVDSHYQGVLSFVLFPGLNSGLKQFGGGVRLPSGIAFGVLHFGSAEGKDATHHLLETMFLGLEGRALGGVDLNIFALSIFAHLDRSEVGAGLHESGNVAGHGKYAVWAGIEGADEGRSDGA